MVMILIIVLPTIFYSQKLGTTSGFVTHQMVRRDKNTFNTVFAKFKVVIYWRDDIAMKGRKQ